MKRFLIPVLSVLVLVIGGWAYWRQNDGPSAAQVAAQTTPPAVAEVPGGADQPTEMGSRGAVDVDVVGGDPHRDSAHGFGGLGGVLGQVGGDRDVGDLAVLGEPDDARVHLGPQVMSQPFGLAGWGTVANHVALAAWRMTSAVL